MKWVIAFTAYEWPRERGVLVELKRDDNSFEAQLEAEDKAWEYANANWSEEEDLNITLIGAIYSDNTENNKEHLTKWIIGFYADGWETERGLLVSLERSDNTLDAQIEAAWKAWEYAGITWNDVEDLKIQYSVAIHGDTVDNKE